jgi:nitroreductase
VIKDRIKKEDLVFFSLIEKRRSIRKFLDKPIENQKIEKIMEAALRAPSSRGLNPWEFIFVTDQTVLGNLSKSKPHSSSFLKNAVLGIVVLADEKKCDVWVEDSSIASIFIQLAAQALELGSCWVQIRKRMHDDSTSAEDYVRKLLQIPETLRVESIIAIGYPGEKKTAHRKNKLQYEKIYLNQYKEPMVTHEEVI